MGVALLVGLWHDPAAAVPSRGATGMGVGVIIGEPTGFSFGWRPAQTWFANGAIAWSLPDERVRIHGDYLLVLGHLTDPELGIVEFQFSAGVGGRAGIEFDDPEDPDTSVLGLRIPLNVSLLFGDFPADVFAEIVPVVGVIPSTDLLLDAGFGARLYF